MSGLDPFQRFTDRTGTKLMAFSFSAQGQELYVVWQDLKGRSCTMSCLQLETFALTTPELGTEAGHLGYLSHFKGGSVAGVGYVVEFILKTGNKLHIECGNILVDADS